MPIYTYRCESCGVQFERHQFFNDAPLKICPECRKKTLRKVITPSKVIFKGSGFYATDHRSPSGSSSREKENKAEKKEESSGNSKTSDSKSSEKSEQKGKRED